MKNRRYQRLWEWSLHLPRGAADDCHTLSDLNRLTRKQSLRSLLIIGIPALAVLGIGFVIYVFLRLG